MFIGEIVHRKGYDAMGYEREWDHVITEKEYEDYQKDETHKVIMETIYKDRAERLIKYGTYKNIGTEIPSMDNGFAKELLGEIIKALDQFDYIMGHTPPFGWRHDLYFQKPSEMDKVWS